MLKTTFKISIAVALLSVGSMAGQGQGKSQGNNNQEITQEVEEITTEVTQERGQGRGQSKNSNKEDFSSDKSKGNGKNSTVSELTEAEKAGIIYIVEEEKVARDVYRHLAESWNAKIFSKIADSEQKHVDAVTKLFSSYNIEMPMTMDEQGIFTSEKLQAMYDELIEKGEQSLEEALKVGIEVEETDIEDLEALLDSNIEEDVEKVYSRILRGSYNHLRSFNRELDK
jgi:hypothetical protein